MASQLLWHASPGAPSITQGTPPKPSQAASAGAHAGAAAGCGWRAPASCLNSRIGPRQKGQEGSWLRATILQAHTKQMPWLHPDTATSQVESKQIAHSAAGLQATQPNKPCLSRS